MALESAAVWMGGIESHMDEDFVTEAFKNVGYKVVSVKEIFHKTTNIRANYCFVDFGDVNIAREVLIRVNNEPIPGAPGKKFNLNRSEYGRSSGTGGLIEYSLFVADLTGDVTDDTLLDFFKPKYPSVRAAKIVKDKKGETKNFGFVRFYDKDEYERSLTEMQGAKGLGKRPIRVNRATKSKSQPSTNMQMNSGGGGMDGSGGAMFNPAWMQMQMQYMQQMQQYMQQCQQYAQEAAVYAKGNGGKIEETNNKEMVDKAASLMDYVQEQHEELVAKTAEMEEDINLVDPNPFVDVAKMNQEIIDFDDKMFFEREASHWDFENSVTLSNIQRPIRLS